MENTYLSPNDVAAMAGLPVAVVRHHLRTGFLPALQLLGRWAITPAAAKKFCKSDLPPRGRRWPTSKTTRTPRRNNQLSHVGKKGN